MSNEHERPRSYSSRRRLGRGSVGTRLRWGDVASGAHFLRRLPAALRRRMGSDEALAVVRARLGSRERDFLWLLREAVYAQPQQPVRRLLVSAGCAYGDVDELVGREGLEGALATLLRAGVYLTGDEIAGRAPVVRGSERFAIDPGALRNPGMRGHLTLGSSGSQTGTPRTVALDLAALCAQQPTSRVAHDAAGLDRRTTSLWTSPGTSGLAIAIHNLMVFGHPLAHWFSPVDVRDPSVPAIYRRVIAATRAVAALQRRRIPAPQFAHPSDPAPVLEWLAAARRDGGRPMLILYPTSAVRLCEAAGAAGADLRGVVMLLLGEPVTTARIEAVRRAGATPWTLYGAVETGTLGHGCLHPAAADDVHLHHEHHAVVQPGPDATAPGLPAEALLITPLRAEARLIVVNGSFGDQATLSRRDCGCALAAVGWHTHLSDIHSFEKLTGMGMTFAAAEVTPVLERLLPARFGGLGTDFQLVEEEAPGGAVRLRLLVHPRLGPLDEAALIEVFLEGLAQVSPTRRLMTVAWRNGGIVGIERRAPLPAPSGKILHFRRWAPPPRSSR